MGRRGIDGGSGEAARRGGEEALILHPIVTRGLDHASRIYPTCAPRRPKSGKPDFEWSIFFARTMDCRVISAFTRVFDALCPAMTAPRSRLDVECDVEMGRRMGDPSRGGVIDPGLGDLGDGVEGDAARGLERKLAV